MRLMEMDYNLEGYNYYGIKLFHPESNDNDIAVLDTGKIRLVGIMRHISANTLP